MTLWRGRRDEELVDEIDTHLTFAEAEYRRAGMSESEARDAARRAFGGVIKTRQLYREQRRARWIDALLQDVRFGIRLLRRAPGFAVTAAVVLGLGIGVNNLMFTLLYGSALRGLPIDRADRVLYISTFDKRFPDRPLSYQDFEDLRTGARSFVGLAAFVSTPLSVGDEGRAPDRFDSAYATAGAFEIIRSAPLLGRTFSVEEDRPGAAPVVLLSRRVWALRYGSDPGVLGRSIFVNGTAATVIGVVPDRAGFPSTAEVWVPLVHAPNVNVQRRDTRTLRVFGRIRDDVSVDDARIEVESIVAKIAHEHPDTSDGLAARVVPINQRFFGGLGNPAWRPFIAASILVIIVSCANAANLMIGRSLLRAREIAIRGSLGANRARVIVQLLVEAVVLASLAAVVGLAISLAAARLFQSAIPAQTLPYWLHYAMDWRIFAALVLVSLGTVLIFGLVPAIQASRVDVNRTLRDGGRSSVTHASNGRLTSTFLVAEFGLSVVLLAQTVVSFQVQGPINQTDAAVDSPALLAATVTLPAAQYVTASDRLTFYDRVREQVQSLPGVAAVTVASHTPFGGAVEQRLEIDGRPRTKDDPAPGVMTVTIGPRYFATLAIPLHRGREFSSQDGRPSDAHAIVNERFVERFFEGGEVLGRRIRLTAPNASAADAPWVTIVGVAPDIRQRNVLEPDPIVYLPLAGAPLSTASLITRSSLEPAMAARQVRGEVARIDPYLPLYRVMSMEQAIYEARWNARASHNLILSITFVALVLSMIGLYAVTAYTVGQRTHEIGIRVALGARPEQVRRLILGRAIIQVGIGLVFGLAGAFMWDSAFVSGRAGLQLVRPDVLGPVTLLLAAVTVTACLIPVRRATRLDPVNALRQE